MRSPMKVLLTGSTGFLGEYLLAELLEHGHSVWCLYRSEHRIGYDPVFEYARTPENSRTSELVQRGNPGRRGQVGRLAARM